ncbi:MAG TPA: tyrosine-type recombinase/integrase [Candidatus Cybelea sp.]|nr:tyrosine-type recombinase/integrase [Candidatus Cybelea sp.]
MRRALTDHERGIDLAPRGTTVSQIAERFFKAAKPDLALATSARYEELRNLHIAPALGAMACTDVKPAHVAELYAKLRMSEVVYRYASRAKGAEGKECERKGKPLSANSVMRIHRFLHRLFGWAERMNLTARNVIRSVEAPKATASPARALDADQVVRILKAAEGYRLHAFFVVAAMTGMRRGEIGALKWDALDLDAGKAIVRQAIGEDRKGGSFLKSTKSGRERVVPLNAAALAAVRAQRAQQAQDKLLSRSLYADCGFVFADQLGGMLDPDSVSKAFSKLATLAGVKAKGISLHSLRHAAATLALQSGTDVRTLAALLGHASPSTTLNVYGHVVAGAQERAVDALGDAFSQAQARAAVGEVGRA